MIKVFIDNSGWYSIINSKSKHHKQAKEYFQYLLDNRAKIYTNILEVNNAIDQIKKDCGTIIAQDFSRLLEEASLISDFNIIWLTRRLRKSGLKQLFSMQEPEIKFNHCIIYVELRRKKINVIFSFDETLKNFGIPVMPQE